MTTDRELLQQALEALEPYAILYSHIQQVTAALRERLAQPEHDWEAEYAKQVELHNQTLDELRDAIAQPQQEPTRAQKMRDGGYTRRPTLRELAAVPPEEPKPIAWMVYTLDGKSVCVTDNPADFTEQHRALPLYTAPPRRELVGLTEDEVAQAMYRADAIFTGPMQFKFAKEIEAKLKEKNT